MSTSRQEFVVGKLPASSFSELSKTRTAKPARVSCIRSARRTEKSSSTTITVGFDMQDNLQPALLVTSAWTGILPHLIPDCGIKPVVLSYNYMRFTSSPKVRLYKPSAAPPESARHRLATLCHETNE